MIARIRWRLARLLVGPFVNVPDRDGVWIVQRAGAAVMTFEADKFRLKTGVKLPRADAKIYGDPASLERFGFARRYGRFVGTVAYR